MDAFLKACFLVLIENTGPGPEGSRLILNNHRSWGRGVEDCLRSLEDERYIDQRRACHLNIE